MWKFVDMITMYTSEFFLGGYENIVDEMRKYK